MELQETATPWSDPQPDSRGPQGEEGPWGASAETWGPPSDVLKPDLVHLVCGSDLMFSSVNAEWTL